MATKIKEETMSIEDLAQMMQMMKGQIEALQKENEQLKNPVEVKYEEDPALNEEVPIQLFKDKGKYKDDVFIAINGERVLVQRGMPVMMKKKYAKVLERSMKQDAETADLINQETSEWEMKAKLLNL